MKSSARPAARALFLLPLLAFAACHRASDSEAPHFTLTPLDTGLYRADLEGRRGLLVFAAHAAHLSVAFDTAAGGVFLAWRGSVRRPDTGLAGRLFWRQDAGTVWTLRRGPDTLRPEVRFAGFASEPGSLAVNLLLVLPSDTVRVRQVLVHDDHYGAHALESIFEFAGLGDGLSASLRVGHPRAGPWPILWAVSGGRVEGPAGGETYVQEFDGSGSFKATFEGSQSE